MVGGGPEQNLGTLSINIARRNDGQQKSFVIHCVRLAHYARARAMRPPKPPEGASLKVSAAKNFAAFAAV